MVKGGNSQKPLCCKVVTMEWKIIANASSGKRYSRRLLTMRVPAKWYPNSIDK